MWRQELDTRNATRRVSQLSAILLHQEQAGEIAKTQLLCVRMCLPRLERKAWQPLSKLGGCSGMSLQLHHFTEAINALLLVSHPPPSARKVRTAARAASARVLSTSSRATRSCRAASRTSVSGIAPA